MANSIDVLLACLETRHTDTHPRTNLAPFELGRQAGALEVIDYMRTFKSNPQHLYET